MVTNRIHLPQSWALIEIFRWTPFSELFDVLHPTRVLCRCTTDVHNVQFSFNIYLSSELGLPHLTFEENNWNKSRCIVLSGALSYNWQKKSGFFLFMSRENLQISQDSYLKKRTILGKTWTRWRPYCRVLVARAAWGDLLVGNVLPWRSWATAKFTGKKLPGQATASPPDKGVPPLVATLLYFVHSIIGHSEAMLWTTEGIIAKSVVVLCFYAPVLSAFAKLALTSVVKCDRMTPWTSRGVWRPSSIQQWIDKCL